MANEALFATAGLFGLFVAMLSGALWDTRLVAAPIRYLPVGGRPAHHATVMLAILANGEQFALCIDARSTRQTPAAALSKEYTFETDDVSVLHVSVTPA